jgi:hypothetical protein
MPICVGLRLSDLEKVFNVSRIPRFAIFKCSPKVPKNNRKFDRTLKTITG